VLVRLYRVADRIAKHGSQRHELRRGARLGRGRGVGVLLAMGVAAVLAVGVGDGDANRPPECLADTPRVPQK
jgi:hypothetical protein